MSSNRNIFHVTGHLCGEFTGDRWIPQRPVTRSFDVFFDLHMNKQLSKQSWSWWFEMPSCSLWRHCNALAFIPVQFLAATKQLYDWFIPYVRLSVCPSVRPSHLFHHVPIIVSSWNFQELLPMTKVTSMQKVKVRGKRSRTQRSTPNLTVSGL